MILSFHPCIVAYQNIPWSYKNMVSNFVVELKNNEGNGLSIRDLKLKQHLKFRKCAG